MEDFIVHEYLLMFKHGKGIIDIKKDSREIP